MVRIITEQGGIRNHNGIETFTPERPVVGPADAGQPARRRRTFRWELCLAAKGSQGPSDQVPGTYVADKTDEVGSMGIKESEGKGIILPPGTTPLEFLDCIMLSLLIQ